MASVVSQLADAPLANLTVIAALVSIGIAIFGWARETLAASAGFRTVSGLSGVLLLFCVYGVYLPHAARSNDAPRPNVESDRTAPMRSAPTQSASALSPHSSSPQKSTPSAKSTTPLLQPSTSTAAALGTPPTDERNGAPEQQQTTQPFARQSGAENLYSGRWKNADPKTASILFLKVDERDGEITVHAWGACLPQHSNGRAGDPISQYCDWGTGHGVVHEGQATVAWQQGPVMRRMKLLPDGASMRVVLDSTSRGRPQHIEAHFAKSL